MKPATTTDLARGDMMTVPACEACKGLTEGWWPSLGALCASVALHDPDAIDPAPRPFVARLQAVRWVREGLSAQATDDPCHFCGSPWASLVLIRPASSLESCQGFAEFAHTLGADLLQADRAATITPRERAGVLAVIVHALALASFADREGDE